MVFSIRRAIKLMILKLKSSSANASAILMPVVLSQSITVLNISSKFVFAHLLFMSEKGEKTQNLTILVYIYIIFSLFM